MTSILNRQGEAGADDDGGFHDMEGEDSVVEGGAKGKTATKKGGRSRKGKEIDADKVFSCMS